MIAQFTHGSPKRVIPQVTVARYSSPRNGPKERPKVIDQRNFITKPVGQTTPIYSDTLMQFNNRYSALKIETSKLIDSYDAAVQKRTLGRDRSLLSETAWHVQRELKVLVQEQQSLQPIIQEGDTASKSFACELMNNTLELVHAISKLDLVNEGHSPKKDAMYRSYPHQQDAHGRKDRGKLTKSHHRVNSDYYNNDFLN
jgi:hypothetical protein